MNLARVLQRLPDLRLQLDARNELAVVVTGRICVCGPHALRLLEIFSTPRSVSEALELLKPSLAGTQDWMVALRTIQQLEAAGVLTEGGGRSSEAPFDRASMHIAMLNDAGRTNAFIEAIRRTVKTGDVVADLGTGTGVLAAAALQAGARKVYAIEAGAVRHQAEALFRDNGFADRVVLMPGWSTQVTLPEPVDVVVGELLGNDPFGEDINDVFRDAVRRFLKPGGKLVPARVELWAALVNVPEDTSSLHRFEPDTLVAWQEAYGIKFDALSQTEASVNFTVSPQAASKWMALSEPVRLMQSDMAAGTEMRCPDTLDVPMVGEGLVNGMVLYFAATLCDGVQISTSPSSTAGDCHWRNVVRLFPVAQKVETNQVVKLDCTAGYLAAKLQA